MCPLEKPTSLRKPRAVTIGHGKPSLLCSTKTAFNEIMSLVPRKVALPACSSHYYADLPRCASSRDDHVQMMSLRRTSLCPPAIARALPRSRFRNSGAAHRLQSRPSKAQGAALKEISSFPGSPESSKIPLPRVGRASGSTISDYDRSEASRPQATIRCATTQIKYRIPPSYQETEHTSVQDDLENADSTCSKVHGFVNMDTDYGMIGAKLLPDEPSELSADYKKHDRTGSGGIKTQNTLPMPELQTRLRVVNKSALDTHTINSDFTTSDTQSETTFNTSKDSATEPNTNPPSKLHRSRILQSQIQSTHLQPRISHLLHFAQDLETYISALTPLHQTSERKTHAPWSDVLITLQKLVEESIAQADLSTWDRIMHLLLSLESYARRLGGEEKGLSMGFALTSDL